MPPKKTTTTTNAPVRRSARLASREPSVASDTSDTVKPTISKKNGGYAATTWKAGDAISTIISEFRNGSEPNILKLTKEQCKAVIVGLAQQNIDLEHDLDESQQQVDYMTPERQKARENASKPSLRRDLTLERIHQNYIKKQQVAPAQAPQQLEVQEPPTTSGPTSPPIFEKSEQQPAPTPSSWRNLLSSVGEYMSFGRKRKIEDAPAVQQSTKRLRVDETEKAQEEPETTPQAPQTISAAPETPSPAPETTPVQYTPSRAQKTPRPAAKHPAMPSSLSTITETTESCPMSAPITPFRVRRAAQLRAARSAQYTTPTSNYVWEKRHTTSRPKEPNADARLAKLNRMRELQQQLDELRKDADIQDMEAQSTLRRKRVKIDNLAAIPHNRPGDSAGTFRVPDPDSDDEIEVESDVSERGNMFEDTEMAQGEPEMPAFVFPVVSARSAEYGVSQAFKDEAGRLFARGFEDFIAA